MSFADELNNASRNKNDVQKSDEQFLLDGYYRYLNSYYSEIKKEIVDKAKNGEFFSNGSQKRIYGEHNLIGFSSLSSVSFSHTSSFRKRFDEIAYKIRDGRSDIHIPIGHIGVDYEYGYGVWDITFGTTEVITKYHHGYGVFRSNGKRPAVMYFVPNSDAEVLIQDLNRLGLKDNIQFGCCIQFSHSGKKALPNKNEMTVQPYEKIKLYWDIETRYYATLYLTYSVTY